MASDLSKCRASRALLMLLILLLGMLPKVFVLGLLSKVFKVAGNEM